MFNLARAITNVYRLSPSSPFATIEEAIAAYRSGKRVAIVIDDQSQRAVLLNDQALFQTTFDKLLESKFVILD